MISGVAQIVLLVLLSALVAVYFWTGRILASGLRTCEFCQFQDKGACKRYPPGRVYLPGTPPDGPPVHDVTVWPVVRPTDRCGEWQQRAGE